MTQKIEFILVSLYFIFISLYTFTFYKFKKLVESSNEISARISKKKKKEIGTKTIQAYYSKISRLLRIKSCFVNCLALKFIYAYYGYSVKIICGVKINKDNRVDGHAWIYYEGKLLSDKEEDIKGYKKSFVI